MEYDVIKFGTDGFRGIMGQNFTPKNVERIVKAICLYLNNFPQKNIIVGYDPRKDAERYALLCSELLKKYGFRVILSNRVVPTPVVAYQAKYYPNSLGAIMLTASHNPSEYQGIKFIPNYGGPATADITDKILEFLDIEPKESLEGSIEKKDLSKEYFEHIGSIIDFDTIRKNSPKIIYDGLFSSSIGYFDELLKKNNIEFKSYNMYHDPDFGGGLPEPKSEFLKHRQQGYLTFANDGDADRYGVIDEKGNYISPNLILAALLRYLTKCQKKGYMIKTVGVSNIVDIVANKLNIKTLTTPVGFKWLGHAMRENPCILAGEDSGGLSTGSHIPEKDGIYANLLILEMISRENKPLYQIIQEMREFSGCEFYQDRIDLKTDKIDEKWLNLESIAGFEVEDKITTDGIKYVFNNKTSSLLIRKSGTEPLLRFYIESNSLDNIDKIKSCIN